VYLIESLNGLQTSGFIQGFVKQLQPSDNFAALHRAFSTSHEKNKLQHVDRPTHTSQTPHSKYSIKGTMKLRFKTEVNLDGLKVPPCTLH
jgi:hypothetical protein